VSNLTVAGVSSANLFRGSGGVHTIDDGTDDLMDLALTGAVCRGESL